ncbi:STAS domain-containing protein [Amphibacillus sp. MSJ-3]|uniref:STAS domain-containing protein n=1 Tax=Amphibacillus sp. MSJ-3 TaxID=2841505 RepID=UPI001C0E9585|nr:STAS domain-containing protein [Amphibacillus sp. MSJ-3]MBU5595712.1 STAS domain-containing protein [Amphibacillus sp. MSJ-3]
MNINLNVELIEQDLVKTLVLSGEIDAYTASILKDALLPLTQQKDAEVIVDLENVDYMDSTGLGVFISALKSSKEHASSLKLVHLQERVSRLFKITSLDTIISIDTRLRGGN